MIKALGMAAWKPTSTHCFTDICMVDPPQIDAIEGLFGPRILFAPNPSFMATFGLFGQMEANMMSSIGVNKVILLGNAGQDAEVKSTSSGKSVANFSLAINRPFRGKKDGHQRVEWVRCVAWDKLAQIAEKFVAKGTVVFVEGRLQTRKFEDREGGTKMVTEVVVASLRVLGGAKASSHSDGNHDATASTATDAESEPVPF